MSLCLLVERLGPTIEAGAIEAINEARDKTVLGDSTHNIVLLNSVGKDVASGEDVDIHGCKKVVERRAQRVVVQGVANWLQKRQSISSIVSRDERLLESMEDIATEAVDFYKSLFGSSNSDIEGCSISLFKNILNVSFSYEAKDAMARPVTREDIFHSMKVINVDKASGDGYTSAFFKAAWNIVGEDVVGAVNYFFATREEEVLKAELERRRSNNIPG
ncbi:hypothetical protein V6N12_068667 [Hibiscus sabdariffa]|uniref:Uncharacterized protein n=1 Tax=Hibiscus sabdariffa TaxID=183260 RepID=A0ABR2FQT6_9ROSI